MVINCPVFKKQLPLGLRMIFKTLDSQLSVLSTNNAPAISISFFDTVLFGINYSYSFSLITLLYLSFHKTAIKYLQ